MTMRTVQLEELKSRSWEEVLREVLEHQESLTVRLSEQDAITIQPAPVLEPLPVLPGRIPEGWKDAVRK